MYGRHVKPRSGRKPLSRARVLVLTALAALALGGAIANSGTIPALAGTNSGTAVRVSEIASAVLPFSDRAREYKAADKAVTDFVLDATREDGNGTGCEFDKNSQPIPEAIPGVFDRLKASARYDRPGKVSKAIRDARYALGWFVGFCYLTRTEGSGYGTQRAEERFSDLGASARFLVAVEVSATATKMAKKMAVMGGYFADPIRFSDPDKNYDPPVAHAIAEFSKGEAREFGCPWDFQGYDLAGRDVWERLARADKASKPNSKAALRFAFFEGYCFLDGAHFEGTELERVTARLGSVTRVALAIRNASA